jgi:outer membrane receptor protein involved in Fe transport
VAAAALLSWTSAQAQDASFNIAPQPLDTALREFGVQSGVTIMADAHDTLAKQSPGFTATADPETALKQLLAGTGLTYRRNGDVFVVADASDPQSGSAAGDGADQGTVQALIVTAQKREENIQDVPIAMSAFTQEDLTRSQVAGGPDLMTQIPNMTFTKTNFSSYSIQIRGIGTQAISATTDAAVAVAFNNTPFIRNRFFEQEFYDLQRVEVLRGPQGTLYGRNATAGVVNIISAKPKFAYEAKLSADVGNYKSTRVEGMVNIPLVEDKIALRLAGAWTKRDGYDTNQITGNQIDGRDLWSTRVSLRLAPTDGVDVNLIWEHFQEDDDRLRSGKQLCKKDLKASIAGIPLPAQTGQPVSSAASTYSQGCVAASMYSPEAFQTPNGHALPYYLPLGELGAPVIPDLDPYLSTTQSRDLRVIESTIDPSYRAKSDLGELQVNLDITDSLTLTSETAYGADAVYSLQDYNRFNTAPGAFLNSAYDRRIPRDNLLVDGVYCDPQLGCANRLVAVDLSTAKSRQFSQEFRISSHFDGAFNFSLGANFLRYDTEDKYYVFINTATMNAASQAFGWNSVGRTLVLPAWEPGVTDNHECFYGFNNGGMLPGDPFEIQSATGCMYIDPNPIGNLNDEGHNYFLSKNPYRLISYAAFGEAYYNITDKLKLTAGLRWTVDKKHAPQIPSWLLAANTIGYPVAEVIDQRWSEPTGRLALDWKPDLSFTDETLLYASYAHGYKAGGANPPPMTVVVYGGETRGASLGDSTRSKTFDPEFVDAFEVGAKNTLFDGRLIINTSAFYYDYTGYQISQIIDRSANNLNFDATVWGLELEADWRPLENLRLGFKGGYENTRVADGEGAIDLMDRTAGDPNWIVARPFPSIPSNCIVPVSMVTYGGQIHVPPDVSIPNPGPCVTAYKFGLDPVTNQLYTPDPVMPEGSIWTGYPGFNPATAPNNGEGITKDLSGNELPNAPKFTTTITADYTLPLRNNWLATLHGDFYYQSEAWARIFNLEGYDKLKAYNNINVALVLANEDAGWKVMAYVKNVLDRDSITGAFLNSDDTGLTTNVFLTEPRLYGIRLTKDWTGLPWEMGRRRDPSLPYRYTVELGGAVQRHDAVNAMLEPGFSNAFTPGANSLDVQNPDLDWGDGRYIRVAYSPSDRWRIWTRARFGRTNGADKLSRSELGEPSCLRAAALCVGNPSNIIRPNNYSTTSVFDHEEHLVVDFAVGRDFGLGILGEGRSSLSVGLRHANLESLTKLKMYGSTQWELPAQQVIKYDSQHDRYETSLTADRRFKGTGPVLSWDASRPLLGDGDTGRVAVDWSVSAGVLFGKQKTVIEGSERHDFYDSDKYQVSFKDKVTTTTPVNRQRDSSVNVPTIDLSLGMSYGIGRVKIGAGYRWERYFDAIDGGDASQRSYDRTIDGPYFKIAVGFGG